MADKMRRCFSKQKNGSSNSNAFVDVRDHNNSEFCIKEWTDKTGSMNPTPSSNGNISSASVHGALKEHLTTYCKARNEFLHICGAFRQEMSRLENMEEALFNNVMKGTVSEFHLTSLQMQFEVCSMLFNQEREQKVLLLELISQNMQRNNNANNTCSEHDPPATEHDQKRKPVVENSNGSAARVSSPSEVHTSAVLRNNFSDRYSCGRTRLELNRVRFGHSHGMFATFGNEQFWYAFMVFLDSFQTKTLQMACCPHFLVFSFYSIFGLSFRMNRGSIQISHLILDNIVSLEALKVWVRRGKTRLSVSCGRALSVTNTPIPVFYDPREENNCIYYVGHYLPSKSNVKELSITICKEFSMQIILEFVNFDHALARAMNTTSKDDRNTCVKSENVHYYVKEEEGEDYLLFHNQRNYILQEASSTISMMPNKNDDVSSSEGKMSLNSDDLKSFSPSMDIVQKNFIHLSCGRTRHDLNKQRVGYNHGMFASFGVQEFW
jgi:hypothetical protein